MHNLSPGCADGSSQACFTPSFCGGVGRVSSLLNRAHQESDESEGNMKKNECSGMVGSRWSEDLEKCAAALVSDACAAGKSEDDKVELC